jgi:hypothetical protein
VSLTMWGAQQLRDATDQYALDSEHQTDLLKNRLDAIEFTEAQNLTYQDCWVFSVNVYGQPVYRSRCSVHTSRHSVYIVQCYRLSRHTRASMTCDQAN